MRPILFYTVGYPGAGKTTLARSIALFLDGAHLRGDAIGLELFRFPTFSPQEKAAVYQEMQHRTAVALQDGRHVLYDASVNTRAQRDQLQELARKHNAHAVGLWLTVPEELARARAAKLRDVGVGQPVARVIPPHVFNQIIAGFEAPQPGEQVITIAGDVPLHIQYGRLRALLHARHRVRVPRLISG